jgi:hypothetical protein
MSSQFEWLPHSKNAAMRKILKKYKEEQDGKSQKDNLCITFSGGASTNKELERREEENSDRKTRLNQRPATA